MQLKNKSHAVALYGELPQLEDAFKKSETIWLKKREYNGPQSITCMYWDALFSEAESMHSYTICLPQPPWEQLCYKDNKSVFACEKNDRWIQVMVIKNVFHRINFILVNDSINCLCGFSF